MEGYLRSNRTLWNNWTSIHERSEFYDLEGFKAGRSSLSSLELEEVGDVSGKRLLHLQCHFGMDTLSWARLGADVTGIDFSDRAIELARSLSQELDIPARFICSDVYELPNVLEDDFDIVYTSGGVLYWLPDLVRWAEVVARFLRPGGFFYIADMHPFAGVFESEGVSDLEVAYPYFQGREPLKFETHGSYADPAADYHHVEYGWLHPAGEIVSALAGAGLRIEYLHEFPYIGWQMFPFMERDEQGWWRLQPPHDKIPLYFSLRATK